MIETFTENLNGTDWVVGDIHGHYSQLMRQLAELKFNFAYDRLFSVGDLIDGGSQPKEVVKLLQTNWFYAVRGNHEQMVIDQFTENRVILFEKEHLTPEETHIDSKGQWFVDLPLAEKQWYFDKFKDLPFIIEVATPQGVVGICHAGIPRGMDNWLKVKAQLNERKIQEEVLRTRQVRYQNYPIQHVGITVHGHTGFPDINQIHNSFWIDTHKKSGGYSIMKLQDLFAKVHQL